MGAYTTRLSLYKPGGGSTGTITPDEPVDIDKINSNFDLIDAAVGIQYLASTALPTSPYNGQHVYVTDKRQLQYWNGSAWALALPDYRLSRFGTSTQRAALTGMVIGEEFYETDTRFLYKYLTVGSTTGWFLWDTLGFWQTPYAAPSPSAATSGYPTGIIFNFGSPLSVSMRNGQVQLRGNVKKSSAAVFADNDALGTFNAAWAPSKTSYFMGNGSGTSYAGLQISNGGVFSIYSAKGTGANMPWICFDGCTFDPYN